MARQACRLLRRAGVIDRRTDNTICRVMKPAHRAAHGKLSPNTDLANLLQRIKYLWSYLDVLARAEGGAS